MKVETFDWDTHNIEKCQKHGLTIEEIESFILSEPVITYDQEHSEAEDRYIAVGPASIGYIVIVFTFRVVAGKLQFRVISARRAREKEVKVLYEKK